MAEHTQDWKDGYHAGKNNPSCIAEGKSAEWISGWLIGKRDRYDNEIMDSFDDSWAS